MLNYLNYLKFTKNSKNIKLHLLSKLDINFDRVKKDLMGIINDNKNKIGCDKWIDCDDDCKKLVEFYISKELSSTAYFLKAISESVISIQKNKFVFVLTTDIENLTGKWQKDRDYIKIQQNNKVKSRLIMGFGPSSSGKTYWATSIVKLFGRVDPSFPTEFISIDGGSYRESSMIYQITKECAVESCYAGFSNLVLAGGLLNLFKNSLFKSDNIKKDMISYLQKESEHTSISLYVPDTLGDCGGILDLRIKSCKDKYKPFIDITKDKSWIGLMIWQHKYKKDCTYSGKHMCFGTTESGKEREKKEGKKYSNTAWNHSMKLGLEEVMNALGGSYIIHNAGQKDHISVLQNVSQSTPETIHDLFKKSQTEFNFTYFYK